jgi:DNA polymerase elongation subunit (family B)
MCAEKVEYKYNAKVVYGDTDSIFIKFPEKDATQFVQVWNKAKDATNYLNKLSKNLGTVMQMEMEKVFTKIWLFANKKKTYFGRMTEDPDMKEVKVKIMGIKTKKRDASAIERFIGKKIINFLNEDKDDKIIPFIDNTIKEIYTTNKFPRTMFMKSSIFKGMDQYKKPESLPQCKVFTIIAKRDPGKVPVPGERIFYTLQKIPPKIGPRGGIKRPNICEQAYPELYINDPDLKINYRIFIEYVLKTFENILVPLTKTDNTKEMIRMFNEKINEYDNPFN